MTCKEIHARFESDPRAAIDSVRHLSGFVEHVGTCPDCNHFLSEQQELRESLRLLCQQAPVLPASVDLSVLAAYRSYVSGKTGSAASARQVNQIRLRVAFSWAAAALAVAAVVAYAAISLFAPGDSGIYRTTLHQHRAVAPQSPSQSQVPIRKRERIPAEPTSLAASARRGKPPISVAHQHNSMPMSFQALMYCDQLSCPAMGVIRVQLPSPLLRAGSESSAGGLISADILVGPDGIARGIRVVE